MTRAVYIALIAVVLAVAACGPPPPPDGSYGTIAGYVFDPQFSEPVDRATIMLIGTKRGAITSEDGYYEVRKVPPGTYTVRVACVAYEPVTLGSVVVHANRITWREVELKRIPANLNLAK